jgi:hypothetical protein
MQEDVPAIPWATIGVWLLTLIAAIVGGVVVIWGDPGALSFEDYIKILGGFAVAHGLLGIGRGINANGKAQAAASMYTTQLYSPGEIVSAPDSEPPPAP